MTVAVVRYTTVGTPVPDPDGGPFDIGYDDVRHGFAILPLDMLDGDTFDPETTRSVCVIAEVETIGL